MYLASNHVLVVHTSLHYLFPNRIMSDSICCVAGLPVDLNTTRKGPVVVFIDNAIVSTNGVEFEYRDDPVYSSASPRVIIPV